MTCTKWKVDLSVPYTTLQPSHPPPPQHGEQGGPAVAPAQQLAAGQEGLDGRQLRGLGGQDRNRHLQGQERPHQGGSHGGEKRVFFWCQSSTTPKCSPGLGILSLAPDAGCAPSAAGTRQGRPRIRKRHLGGRLLQGSHACTSCACVCLLKKRSRISLLNCPTFVFPLTVTLFTA